MGIVLGLAAVPGCGQIVSEREGNIIFIAQDGARRQVTDRHLDAEPSLSFDNRQAVFVRRTPGHPIETGIDAVDDNELWVAPVDGSGAPRRVLAGHAGGFDPGPEMVLAGFGAPQFSPDGKRIYFTAATWATASAIHTLDLTTGKTTFLFPGLGVEVIRTGEHAGFLIGEKDPITQDRGRIVIYWLLNPDGSEVRRIGETADDVTQFKTSTSAQKH